MKKSIPCDMAYRLINHGPVILVSTLYRGKRNVCTIAWVTPVDSDLVALVVSEENYTFRSIRETGEFVLNIPDRSLVKKVVICGSVSGEACDKFSMAGLTSVRARRVAAPLVKECIAHLECVLIKGEERLAREYNLFIARVVAASAEKGLFTTRWNVRLPRAKTLHHLGGNVFAVPSGRIVK